MMVTDIKVELLSVVFAYYLLVSALVEIITQYIYICFPVAALVFA